MTQHELSIMNDDDIIEYARQHRMLLREKRCWKCKKMCSFDSKVNAFRCQKTCKGKKCNYYLSLHKNTFFEQAQLSVKQVLLFSRYFCYGNFSVSNVKFSMRLSSKTAVDWNSFCREVAINLCMDNNEMLGGKDVVVEVDEAKFGKRKGHKGRKIEGVWVFGAFERESKKLCVAPVVSRDSKTLVAIIKKWIKPGTTIMSDCWPSYQCLEQHDYLHLTVNHSLNFVDPETGAHTQNIERSWRDLKDVIPKYGRKKAHTLGYLARALMLKKWKDPAECYHQFLFAAAKLYNPGC